jgi:hypothetical protein
VQAQTGGPECVILVQHLRFSCSNCIYAHSPANGDKAALIREAIAELSVEEAKNPSYLYAHVLTKAIQNTWSLTTYISATC